MRTLSECDTVHNVIRFVVNQFQFDMFLIASNHLAGTVIIDMMCAEDRFDVVRNKPVP